MACKSFFEISENEQKTTLRNYLKKYKNIKFRIIALERRKNRIAADCRSLKSPACNCDPVQGNGNSSGAAAMTFRTSEIETDINRFKKESERAIEEICNIVSLLSVDSIERTIIEYRYLDLMSWKKIYLSMNYSKSRCHDYENAGLTILLTFAKVQKIVLDNYNKEVEERERLKKIGQKIIENKKHRTQSDT